MAPLCVLSSAEFFKDNGNGMNNLNDDNQRTIKLERSDYKRPKNRINPIWSVVWRFLLVCFVIDGGIYTYFHFVKNMTISDGLKMIRSSITHGSDENGRPLPEIVYVRKPENVPQPTVNQVNTASISNTPNKSYNQPSTKNNTLYCWEDSEGKRHYSNQGYPTNGNFKKIQMEN